MENLACGGLYLYYGCQNIVELELDEKYSNLLSFIAQLLNECRTALAHVLHQAATAAIIVIIFRHTAARPFPSISSYSFPSYLPKLPENVLNYFFADPAQSKL